MTRRHRGAVSNLLWRCEARARPVIVCGRLAHCQMRALGLAGDASIEAQKAARERRPPVIRRCRRALLRCDRLPIDGPSARAAAAVDTAQKNGSRFAPHPVIVAAGQVAIEPIPHNDLSELDKSAGRCLGVHPMAREVPVTIWLVSLGKLFGRETSTTARLC